MGHTVAKIFMETFIEELHKVAIAQHLCRAVKSFGVEIWREDGKKGCCSLWC